MVLRRRRRAFPWVILVGPDGVGKSAVTRAIESQVAVARHEHFRALVRPVSGRAVAPHAKAPSGMVMSIVKIVARFGEQWVAQVPRYVARRQGLMLQERGWWDQVIDPRRYRLPTGAVTVVKILGRWLPRPDYAFLLCANAAVVVQRKGELSAGEVDRQLAAWRAHPPLTKAPMLVLDAEASNPEELAIMICRHAGVQGPGS